HHRKSGTATVSKFLVEFQNGRKDYLFGCSLLYHVCRSTYRLTKKPIVLGGFLLLAGYVAGMLSRSPKTVSDELVRFRRGEQRKRLQGLIRNLLIFSRHADSSSSNL